MKTSTLHLFLVRGAMVAAVVALAACSSTPAAPAVPAPTQAAPALSAPAPAQPANPTATTAVSASSQTIAMIPITGIPTTTVKPDDATMARLTVGQCIFNGPKADVYINGQMTENGGVPFRPFDFDAAGPLYLSPGTIKLAVTPRGQGLDKALLAPMDVALEAGHRYTVMVMGQAADAQHTALLIDQTQVVKDAGATPDQFTLTIVNNLDGAPAIDHVINGQVHLAGVPYGGYKTEVLPPGPYTHDVFTVSGAPDKIVDPDYPSPYGAVEAGADAIQCYGGKFAGAIGQSYDGFGTTDATDATVLDLLRHFTDRNKAFNEPALSFDTFLSLVKTAGMTDELNAMPHLVLAPTDAAFQSIPKDKLDALLADPKAAGDLLKETIVQGVFPAGSLSTGGGGWAEGPLQAMSGKTLTLLTDNQLKINGTEVGDLSGDILTANGSRVISIGFLIQAPK